jgi:hypothetical protein
MLQNWLAEIKHLVFGSLAFVLFFGAAGHTRSADVHALFDLSTPTGGPFPSNWFTVPDSQNTGRRVDLPLPDPGTNPSDYHDAQVLNTHDGFSMQPRLSIPFDGAIDVNTVNSQTVFLISLGDRPNRRQHQGEVVGINQVVWDAATTTLFVGFDGLLAQHTRYALIATNGVHDANGNPVQASQEFRHNAITSPSDLWPSRLNNAASMPYRRWCTT